MNCKKRPYAILFTLCLCVLLQNGFFLSEAAAETSVDDHRRVMATMHQMKLKGGARITFKHAYIKYLEQMRKWEMKSISLERKYDPYRGDATADTKVLAKLNADKSKLESERTKIEERLDKKLERILTPQQFRLFHNLNKKSDPA